MLPHDITPEKAYQMLIDMGEDPNTIQQKIQMSRPYDPASRPIPDYKGTTPFENWGKGIKEYAPQGIGATIGSIAFPAALNIIAPPLAAAPEEAVTVPLGAKIGAGLGRLAGAIWGGAGGKGYQQTHRMLKESPKAPRTLTEIYDQQAKAAVEEGIGELLGMGIGAGISKVRAPMKHKLIPGADKASQRLAQAGTRIPTEELTEETAKHLYKQPKFMGVPVGTKKPGVILTPGQRTIAPNIDWIENATEGSIFGGGPLYHLKKVLQPKALKVLTKELSEEFWEQAVVKGSPAEIGQLFLEAVQNKKLASQRIIKMLYGQVDQTVQGMARVDLRLTKEIAQQMLEEASKSRGLGSSSGITKIAKRVISFDDAVDFKTAQMIRSNILEETRKLEGLMQVKLPKVDRVAKTLSQNIDTAMSAAAKRHSPEAYGAWRTANAATKKLYEDVIANQYIEGLTKLADKRPHEVARILFQPNAVEPVKAAHKILDQNTWKSLVAAKVDQLLIPPKGKDVILGSTFLHQFNSLGDDVLRHMFTSEQIVNIREIGNIAKLVQEPIGRGGGSMVMQLTQAGAIVGTATGLVEGTAPRTSAAGILLGPAGVGKLLTSPKGAKWLSEGLKTPRWSSNATALAIRILKAARGVPDVELPKPPKKALDWNPFKGFPRGPRIVPEGFPFSKTKERTEQELLLKTAK